MFNSSNLISCWFFWSIYVFWASRWVSLDVCTRMSVVYFTLRLPRGNARWKNEEKNPLNFVISPKIWIILTVSMIWNNVIEHAVKHVIDCWKIILTGLIWTSLALWSKVFGPVGVGLVSEKMAVETHRYWNIRLVFRNIVEIIRIKLNVKKWSAMVQAFMGKFLCEMTFPGEWTFSTTQNRRIALVSLWDLSNDLTSNSE